MDLSWVPITLTSLAAVLAGAWAVVQIFERSGTFTRYEKWHKIRSNLDPEDVGFEYVKKQEYRALVEFAASSSPRGRFEAKVNVLLVLHCAVMALAWYLALDDPKFHSFGEGLKSVLGMVMVLLYSYIVVRLLRDQIRDQDDLIDRAEEQLRAGHLPDRPPSIARIFLFIRQRPYRVAGSKLYVPRRGRPRLSEATADGGSEDA